MIDILFWVVVLMVGFPVVLVAACILVKAVTYAFYRARHKEWIDWEKQIKGNGSPSEKEI